jgi:hypothetical protein
MVFFFGSPRHGMCNHSDVTVHVTCEVVPYNYERGSKYLCAERREPLGSGL